MLEVHEQGFDPDYVVADGGNASPPPVSEVLPDTPCRSGAAFHAVAEVQKVVTKLENRAYQTLTTCVSLAKKQANFQKKEVTGGPMVPTPSN